MEKYAVDSTDKIEQKASELIKEGSVKNIDDARKKAVTHETPSEDVNGPERKTQ